MQDKEIQRQARITTALDMFRKHKVSISERLDEIAIHLAKGHNTAATSCIMPLKEEVARLAAFLYFAEALATGDKWREEDGKAKDGDTH